MENPVHQRADVVSREGVMKGGHFVSTASEGPNVRLVIIGSPCKLLWTHVVRGSYHCVRQV